MEGQDGDEVADVGFDEADFVFGQHQPDHVVHGKDKENHSVRSSLPGIEPLGEIDENQDGRCCRQEAHDNVVNGMLNFVQFHVFHLQNLKFRMSCISFSVRKRRVRGSRVIRENSEIKGVLFVRLM